MRLSRKRLRQIIQEEAVALSERKLPPREDPEIVAQWDKIKPSLEQLAVDFKESTTGPHYTMAKDVQMFIKRTDGGMRFASYGELDSSQGQASDYSRPPNPNMPQVREGWSGDVMGYEGGPGGANPLAGTTNEGWQDMSPEADQAYKDIIKVIQDKSKSLNDDDSYNFLVALKDWTNKNVM